MKKDFITVLPDSGGSDAQVQVTADANPSFASRETTINFNANGQVMKSVKAVQDGMPFVCQLGFDAPANLSQGLFIQYFGLTCTGGTNGCPLINGIIARIIKSNNDFKLIPMFGCLRSFWKETDDKELIAELKWTDNAEYEVGKTYLNFTFDNEDGEEWANYIAEFSGADLVVPSDAYRLRVGVGFGRGDVGIEANDYIWQYYLSFQ